MHNVIIQVCLAYRNGEAKVVVVMTQRPKLVMESTFRRIIPDEQRFGTKFVFRQGSALIPDNMRMVAASQAAATIIVSDSSRYVLIGNTRAICSWTIIGTQIMWPPLAFPVKLSPCEYREHGNHHHHSNILPVDNHA